MIQIDDAGSGSLLGGTCIGTLRVETGEYRYGIIPIELYDPDNFKAKKYLDSVVEIAATSLTALNVKKNEKVSICRGYMFDRLKKWLERNFYNWESTVIHDPLQSIVEKTFEDYAVSLGLPQQYIRYTKYPFHFHRLLKWVYADHEKRKRLCKQGWDSWQKYGNLERKIYLEKAVDSNYCCLICGKKIHKGSPVRVVQYITTTLNRAYTHIEC
ncbi:MAG: hypothetical protein WCS98_07090 [Bacillota bacterium]|jgi:hypothetical protein|nr:hypothetical protein [Bacillota bacterium]MDD3850870.1 hypothetical protein [Bacillota bacterium]